MVLMKYFGHFTTKKKMIKSVLKTNHLFFGSAPKYFKFPTYDVYEKDGKWFFVVDYIFVGNDGPVDRKDTYEVRGNGALENLKLFPVKDEN